MNILQFAIVELLIEFPILIVFVALTGRTETTKRSVERFTSCFVLAQSLTWGIRLLYLWTR